MKRNLLLVAATLSIIASASAAETWPGLSRVQRDGQPSNYASQPIAELEKSGVVSQFSLNPDDQKREPDQTIDLAVQDDFNDALRSIESRAKARLPAPPAVTDLLAKKEWTLEDRARWEQELAQTESEERHATPGLGAYRSVYDPAFRAERRPPHLNDLADDIRRNTQRLEFDCEAMTAVDGIVLGRLERALLPAEAAGPKRAVSYARTTGYIYMEFDRYTGGGDPVVSGHHVFLLSPLTGNFIEATADPREKETVYRTPMQAWGGLAAYLTGASALVHAEKKFIYYTSLPDDKAARAIVGALKQKDYVAQVAPVAASLRAGQQEILSALSAYEGLAETKKLRGLLQAAGGRGFSATDADQIREILKSPAALALKAKVAQQKQPIEIQLEKIRNLLDRLQDPAAAERLSAERDAILAEAQAALDRAVFDVETAAVSKPGTVLKEKLSGKYWRPVPLEDYPTPDQLPAARAVSAAEDLGVKLK